MSDVFTEIVELTKEHEQTWRDKPDSYWLARLVEEVGELAGALVGDHEGPVEWELIQIASICANWLDKRSKRPPATAARRRDGIKITKESAAN